MTTRNVPIDAVSRLVTNQLITGKSEPKIVVKLSRLGSAGIHPVSVNTADPAFSDVEIIQTSGATKKIARMNRTVYVRRSPGFSRHRRGAATGFERAGATSSISCAMATTR